VEEASRRWTVAAKGEDRSAPLLGRSVQDGPHLGSSLTGACVSLCCFQKVLIHIKRSSDKGVMPVLRNPSLRRISSDSGHRIWQMIYSFRSSRRALRNVVLLGCSFVRVDWDMSLESYVSLTLLFSYLVPANHNFTKTHGNMLV
jgi:hypothetical protein